MAVKKFENWSIFDEVVSTKCAKFLGHPVHVVSSGAGTNLKVGGGMSRKIFVVVVPLQFFGSTCTISRFSESFRDGQYSLVRFCLLVLYSRCPMCQAICKSRRYVLPCPMESAPLVPSRKMLA